MTYDSTPFPHATVSAFHAAAVRTPSHDAPGGSLPGSPGPVGEYRYLGDWDGYPVFESVTPHNPMLDVWGFWPGADWGEFKICSELKG